MLATGTLPPDPHPRAELPAPGAATAEAAGVLPEGDRTARVVWGVGAGVVLLMGLLWLGWRKRRRRKGSIRRLRNS